MSANITALVKKPQEGSSISTTAAAASTAAAAIATASITSTELEKRVRYALSGQDDKTYFEVLEKLKKEYEENRDAEEVLRQFEEQRIDEIVDAAIDHIITLTEGGKNTEKLKEACAYIESKRQEFVAFSANMLKAFNERFPEWIISFE